MNQNLSVSVYSGVDGFFTQLSLLGPEWVTVVLVVLACVSLAVILERHRYFSAVRDDLGALSKQLVLRLQSGDLDSVRLLLRGSPTPAARVALAGLQDDDHGPETREHAMRAEFALVRRKLERNLGFLRTVASYTPFVGLLGTVIAIVQSFNHLSASSVLQASAVSATVSIASNQALAAVSHALIATEVALFVSVIAAVSYYAFQRIVKDKLAATEYLSQMVLSHVHALADRHRLQTATEAPTSFGDSLPPTPILPIDTLGTTHSRGVALD